MLKCDPHLSGTKELVDELNKSNGLFKFVRTMREKFQQAAAQGTLYLSFISLTYVSNKELYSNISSSLAGHVSEKTYNDYPGVSMHSSSLDQDSSVITVSAPVASFSTDHRHESIPEIGLQSAESNSISRKVGKGNQVQSPRSASSVRRSARVKVTCIYITRT